MSGYLPHAVRPHAADSRLLSNLIRSEKDYTSNLSSSVHSANTAASALAAWGTSEVQDVGVTSEELSKLLHDVAEAQRTHVQALEGYRAALKDILDRETSIRDIVRDRDILVNRLIKASKKKHKEGREEEREYKIQDAQRELQACEQILASEEAALIGVKRRTFKEALTMRMKTMGDVGNAMVEAAQEAILLLDDFDSNVVAGAMMPTGGGEIAYAQDGQYYDGGYEDEQQAADSHAYHQQGLPDGYNHPADASGNFENASVTPSQSASQVAGHASYQNFRNRQDGLGATTNGGVPAPHQLGQDAGTGGEAFMPAERQAPSSSLEPGTTIAPPPSHPHASTQRERIERASQQPMPHIEMPPLPQAYRAGQQMNFGPPSPAAPTPPAKDQDAVAFPRYQRQQPTGMGMGNGAGQGQEDSSSDEDDRPTVAHAGGRGQMTPQPPHLAARGGHGRNFSADMSSTGGSGAFDRGQTPDAPGMGKKKSSFLGRVGKLFKTDVAAPIRESPTPERERRTEGWHTRTDSNARSASRNERPASGLTRSGSRRSTLLSGHAFQAPRQEADDSSDDEPQDVVRHTNPSRPLWQTSASDVGPSPLKRGLLKRNDSSSSRFSITAGPMSWKQKQEEEEMMRKARLSVVGAGIGGAAASGTDLTATKTKKKKKRAPSITGSEIGTSATRTAPAAPSAGVANKHSSVIVPGDASMGIRRSDSLNTTGRGSVKSKSKKRQSLSGISMGDSKFATASWVTPPGSAGQNNDGDKPKTAADFAANAGVVPRGQGQSTREAVSGATQAVQENSYSSLSRSNSSSLKPALKGSLKRNSSVKSNASTSRPPLPDLGPVMRAPPPATSLLKEDSIYKGPVAGQLPPVPKAPTSDQASAPPAPRQAQPQTPSGKVRASEAPRLSDLYEGQARETDADSFSSALEDGEEMPKRAQSSVSANKPVLVSNQSFDGTGALDMSVSETPKSDSTAEAPAAQGSQRVSALPKLEMPVHEPFSFSLDGRKGSNAGGASDPENSGLITPGEHSAIQKLLSTGEEKDKEIPKKQPDTRTSDGVTRVTARSTKLAPSRVYGSGAPEISSSSDDESLVSERPRVPNFSAAPSATQASTPLASALRSPSPAPKGVLVHAPGSVAGSTAMSDASGSVVGRRKSVRLAPDTKLPPETPTSPAPPPLLAIPFHAHAPGSSVVGSQGTPALSSRIAPAPAAPARPAKDEGPHTLANDSSSSRPGWSTRIGALDDSSDEEIVGGGDDYSKARRAFSSASRHLGKATGTTKPKATDDGTSSIGKKKKRSSKANFGYNPEVPLPPTMQVVGRSNSTRK